MVWINLFWQAVWLNIVLSLITHGKWHHLLLPACFLAFYTAMLCVQRAFRRHFAD